MTAPKTARRPRTRKPQPSQALAVRTAPSDLAADLLILSSRLAVTQPPVFWADGELDARTALAPVEADDWDAHYRRVLGDTEYDWDWYRAARFADELEAVPAVTLTVVPDLPVIMPGTPLPEDKTLDERVAALMKLYDDEPGTSWGAVDVPGPEGGADPSAPSTDTPHGAPGPGAPDDEVLP